MAHHHPYCCDEFAQYTNEFNNYNELKQNDDGSWVVVLDDENYEFGPIRFCPFCGSRSITRLGIECVRFRGRNVFNAGGSITRWRDLAPDGIYEVDDDGLILRIGNNKHGAKPEIHHKPDTRPVIIDGVYALREDGTPAIVEDLKEWSQYEFDPKTRIIKLNPKGYSNRREPSFFIREVPEPEPGEAAVAVAPTALD